MARKYSREELLALRDSPGCRDLPPGLEADDLSDLQESCFFDKAPTPDAGIYLGPQRGPGGPGARAPFGAGPARRPAGGPPGPIHSRLIDEDERGAYQRTNSGQLQTAFGGSSPSKPQAIAARAAGGRFGDPSKMDRWDSQKLAAGAGPARDPDNWQQQKARGAGAGDNWRANAANVRGSLDAQRGGSGWGGGSGGGNAELPRSGSSAPKDNGSGRWVKDDDDWRARKQAGAVPEPRYDWSDNRAQAAAAGPGAAARGPPPGFHDRGERAPEWADSDAGMRPRMTAADIEAERLRMQEQWKKQGGNARSAAESSMAEIMTDDDIMSMMQEEQEKQACDGGRPAANGKPDAAPKAGQHVDVAALLGGRPQPGSPGGIGSPASAAGSERAGAEGVRSRFANFFKLEDVSPAPGAAGAVAGGPGAAPPGPRAPGGPSPQQLSFEQLSRAAGQQGGQREMPAMPTAHVATPGEIEQRLPGAPPGGAPPPGQARDAGQALLAMLKQQQAAQRAAAGGGQAPRQMMPPNAVSAADVTVLEEADKVARLTALQGLDDDMLGETKSPPPAATQLPPQQQRSPLPPGMQLPPGAMPPPHGPGQPGPPHPGMPGYAGQLPPGMMPPGMHMGPPPPGAPFPPHGMQHMGPMPPGMQHGPPPPGMQYRPPGGAGMQYRPPSVLPPQPGMPPGMQHPQPGQQAQQAQQNALLAQLLAAQAASRGAPPQQQHVQPGQQINLAALLGAAGNPGMQLPPMPQTALNPAQLQGLHGLRPPGGMLPPGMPGPGPGLPHGINPQLLQQLQMQQQGLQRPMPPPMQHPHPQQQLSSAQLMAALGLAQGGMPQQGLR